jgi:NADH:ubiquinone oxidoreductase subunit D
MEAVTGTRLTTGYTRIGGLFRDAPPEFPDMVRKLLAELPPYFEEFRVMTIGNRILEDRLRGTGVISGEEAVSWGLTGPILRASGVAYDVRKARPYCGYERYDFEVPTQSEGDSWARFVQRFDEMDQSLRIIEQALEDLPDGPVNVDDKKAALPDKQQVYQNIESVIHHFKQFMFGHGHRPEREAEVYSATEAPNGELGYYLVSDGEMVPYRVRVRPPSLYHFAVFPRLAQHMLVSDVVAILSTLNVIAGELDR